MLFETLRHEPETIGNGSIKPCSFKMLNDYVNPILTDLDPEQGIEDQYKRKHNQVFCWRFLRSVSFLDQGTFQVKKKDSNRIDVFNGNVETIATAIQSQAPKPGKKEESEMKEPEVKLADLKTEEVSP